MPTIRIDDEVYAALQKLAKPLRSRDPARPDTENKVLRMLLKLPPFDKRGKRG